MANPDDALLPPPPPNPRGEKYVGEDEALGEDAMLRMIIPVGRSAWAIAAGYLGLISVLLVPAPLAVIAGILAVREIKKDPKKHGMGRAIFGIVMGSLGTAVGIVVLVIGILNPPGRR